MSSGTRSSGVPSVRIELADRRRIQGFVDEGYGPGRHGLDRAHPAAHAACGFCSLVNPGLAKWMDLCTTWPEHLIGALPSDREFPTSARRSLRVRHRLPTDDLPGNPACRSLILKYLPGLEADVNLLNIVRASLWMINPFMHWMSEGSLTELDRGLREVPHGRESGGRS